MCDEYYKELLLKLTEGNNNKAIWNIHNDGGENDDDCCCCSNDCNNETDQVQRIIVCDNARVHNVSVGVSTSTSTSTDDYSDMPVLRRYPRMLQRKSSYRKNKLIEQNNDKHLPFHHQNQNYVIHNTISLYPYNEDRLQMKKVSTDYWMIPTKTTTTAFVSITATAGSARTATATKFADCTIQWNIIPSLQRIEQPINFNKLDETTKETNKISVIK